VDFFDHKWRQRPPLAPSSIYSPLHQFVVYELDGIAYASGVET
jgi:hypothetical protein